MDELQKPIEELELKIDARLRAKEAEEKAQHMDETEGGSRNNNERILLTTCSHFYAKVLIKTTWKKPSGRMNLTNLERHARKS